MNQTINNGLVEHDLIKDIYLIRLRTRDLNLFTM